MTKLEAYFTAFLVIFFCARHGCGKFQKLAFRPHWASNQSAAAVRANPLKFVLCAVTTKRAFKRTDARIRRRRQVFIATLAIGTKLQHLPAARY